MPDNAAHNAVESEWRHTQRRIADAEAEVAAARSVLTTNVAELARLRDVKTQLEAHAAQQGWALKPPEFGKTNSVSSEPRAMRTDSGRGG